jgi:hypothetical protein
MSGVELFDSRYQGEGKMDRITTNQIAELLAQDKVGRVTRELLQAFLQNPQSINGQLSSKFTVSVDYGKTVEEMVAAGRYDWHNDNITTKNFPVSGTGVVTVDLELVHLNKAVSSEEVLAHLEANGLRPATIEELLAFGAIYPEIQRKFPIVCLGSFWVDPSGIHVVPYLGKGGSNRRLNLLWFVSVWGDYCRFLAVRKPA